MPLKVQIPLATIGLELYQLGVHTRAKKLQLATENYELRILLLSAAKGIADLVIARVLLL